MNYIYHHGILGQKWGIRRYQNKDGTLTDLGRKRLGVDKYINGRNEDFVLKKGTRATRAVSLDRMDEFRDFGGADKYINDVKNREKNLDTKYVSVDGIRNKGANGEEYYLSWFSDSGYMPDNVYLDEFKLKTDVKVASGEKVLNALVQEVGDKKIASLIKDKQDIKRLAMEYTTNKELFNKVNDKFLKLGYDAVEDINDRVSDMPIIMLNSKKSLGDAYNTKTGKQAINDYLKRHS